MIIIDMKIFGEGLRKVGKGEMKVIKCPRCDSVKVEVVEGDRISFVAI